MWARPDEFMLDVSLGVPPDAFSATGQDWGLPTYRWDRIAQTGYAWMRQRARRMAALYDGYRVDHLVGLFRTYGKPPAGRSVLQSRRRAGADRAGRGDSPHSARERRRRSLPRISAWFRRSCATSLARLGVPGCKVLRWERDWDAPGHPFIDPATYPAAVGGDDRHARHGDARRMVDASEGERARDARRGATTPCADDAARRVLRAYGSGSDDLFLPAAGRVRLDRSHQRAGDGRRSQLDVATAVAGGSSSPACPRRANARSSARDARRADAATESRSPGEVQRY